MMETQSAITRRQYFGVFMQQRLRRAGVSRREFARNLRLEPGTVDALLAGAIPVGYLSDELLTAMALQVDLDPHVLHLALGWVKLGTLSDGEVDTAPADNRETQEVARHCSTSDGQGRLQLADVMVTLGSFVTAANHDKDQPLFKTLQSFIEQKS